MGAIFGLIGAGSADEVEAMGRFMPHRGQRLHTWRPGPNVCFGTLGAGDDSANDLALDGQLDDVDRLDGPGITRRGIAGLAALSGYFSLAHYDASRRSVLLACDTSGFKSLYYARLPGRVAFASEYKALLALPDFQPELNRQAAQFYLATRSFRMQQPLMAGVCPIIAGGAVTITPDLAVHDGQYWRPASRPSEASEEELARDLRATLERVVRRQVGSFSRVAVTLSGGLDSACVLALLRHVRPDVRVDSFTIGYGPNDPECIGGRELATQFNTVHHELTFDPQHLPEGIPGLVWLMEDCAGREEALLQHLVLAAAARTAPVVFGGYGADVVFAGMPRYRLIRMRELLPCLATPLKEVFQFTQTGIYPQSRLGKLATRLLYPSGTFPAPGVAGAGGAACVPDDWGLDAYIANQLCEAQDSGYIEVSLEAAGAQFRDPFQATEVMDLAMRIPGRLNVSLWQQKQLLRRALADLLPSAVLARRKSMQRVRHDLQLSEALDEMASRLLSPDTIRARGLVSDTYMRSLRSRAPHEAYGSERLYRLWTLVCLELWQRQFLDLKNRMRSVVRPAPAQLQPVVEAIA